MAEITKEYLDKSLDENFKNSKEYLEKLLKEQTVVNFKLTKEYVDGRFNSLDNKIDTLAASTAEEFSIMHEKFSSIEMQFLRLSSRIDDVENRVIGYQKGTTTRLSVIESKLETIQQQLKDISRQSLEDTAVVSRDIHNLQKRVAVLEKQLQKFKTKQAIK